MHVLTGQSFNPGLCSAVQWAPCLAWHWQQVWALANWRRGQTDLEWDLHWNHFCEACLDGFGLARSGLLPCDCLGGSNFSKTGDPLNTCKPGGA